MHMLAKEAKISTKEKKGCASAVASIRVVFVKAAEKWRKKRLEGCITRAVRAKRIRSRADKVE